MPQFQFNKIHQQSDEENRDTVNWNTINHQSFIKALISANTPDLTRSFLDDLLTKTEIETFARRFQIACLIMMGTPYKHIIQLTGMSPKIISRISKSMVNKRGGFQTIIKKMHPSGMHYFD